MRDDRLPMTVISGYLGAGKTTLINRLLSEPHGKRLLVLVNDFGAVNIDAGLLVSADEDTITLTNGCVCCSMGAELAMAVSDALGRDPRADHLIVEASGVADPVRIANMAIAEPELRYGGIVTVVDANSYNDLINDDQVGLQVSGQIQPADCVMVSKCEDDPEELYRQIKDMGVPIVGSTADPGPISDLVLAGATEPLMSKPVGQAHANYVSWSYQGDKRLDRGQIDTLMRTRPDGLFRLKGTIASTDRGALQVQVVGRNVDMRRCSDENGTQLVGIGLCRQVTRAEIDAWWQENTA